MDKPKVILVMHKPFRIGAYVYDSVGPFVTIGDAWRWFERASRDWQVQPPKCTSHEMYTPDASEMG